MSKDREFEIGDIVEITNPFHTLYGRRMLVSGYKSNGWFILKYIGELNTEEVETPAFNLKLVKQKERLRLDDAGSGAVGVTPSQWVEDTDLVRKVKQFKDTGYACGGYTSDASTWAGNINKEFMQVNSKHITEDNIKAAEQSVNQFNNIIKENKMATEKLTIEVDVKQLGLIGKTKKEKTPKIVCKIDGELMEFKNEEALKAFMWTARCNEVIRYDLVGKVSVPFELTTTQVK